MNSGTHEFLAQDRVIWGRPAAAAVADEARRRGVKRVFIVSSRTLHRNTPVVSEIRAALGAAAVGVFDECREHTPRDSVIAAAAAARAATPDLVVTIGGGTAIDTVKVMLIALAHELTRPEQFDDYHLRLNPDGSRHAPAIAAPPCRQVVVSTTLGAAEFSDLAGCTDTARGVKDAYSGRLIGAAAVILDPAITVHTPEWLWLSTGVRGIDHAVEGLCSIARSPLVEATSLHALKLFGAALPQSKADPANLEARLACQQAAWLAGLGILRVPYGASHGIGHALGGATGMSHGYTSCVMLPHVMRWNFEATRDRQAAIAAALGRSDSDAPRAIAELIAGLGMPVRLRDARVSRDKLPRVAAAAMQNMWVKSNPRPLDEKAVLQLLEAAW